MHKQLENILSELLINKSNIDRDFSLGNLPVEDYELHQARFIEDALKKIENIIEVASGK